MSVYVHPWKRGFSFGLEREGATRVHLLFWRWEWAKWFRPDKIDDNYVESFLKKRISSLEENNAALRAENDSLRKTRQKLNPSTPPAS